MALADRLEQAGRDWRLVEARARLGGRIHTVSHAQARFDLGPSWFWPGQDRMAALADRLGIAVFEQYAQGIQLLEDRAGQVHPARGFASMAGSLRLEGGMTSLIDGLASLVPDRRIETAAPVRQIGQGTALLADGRALEADHIVVTLPPRVAAELSYAQPLDTDVLAAMRAIPTWMGGQAKCVAIYAEPFWRMKGLSGDASSQRGPLVEIHDATSMNGVAALFGFVGVPPQARADHADQLQPAILDQLGRLFGEEALSPSAFHLMDWATEPHSTTALDLEPLRAHPDYGPLSELSKLADQRLHFSGTELAPEMGGYLEGALAAAEAMAHRLT